MSRFDIGMNIRSPKTVAATVEGFYQMTDDPQTRRICAELADALEALKRGELSRDEYKELKNKKKQGSRFYTPHAHFNKGYKRSDGEPVDSGKVIIDLDGCEGFEALYEQHLKGREKALGINAVYFSMSKTGGHVLFEMPAGMSREEAQAWMAHEMGDVVYDKAVHELERAIYIPCREYFLYIDEELMFSDEKDSPLTLQPHPLTPSPKGEGETFGGSGEGVVTNQEESSSPENVAAQTHSPTDRTRYIFNACMRECGLEPEVLVVEGARHDAVKSILSVGATQLLTQEEFVGVLSEAMPNNWQDPNIQQLVADFYTKYHDTSQKMTQFQRNVFAKSIKMNKKRPAASNDSAQDTLPSGRDGEGASLPTMPTKLPKLVQLLTSKTPEEYKAAVAHAIFPPLATHLCDVRFTYTDNKIHEATLMNCLMAGTGAGKGCIDEPITHIMADIRRRDAENERREAEWKKDCQKKGANKDKQVRPEGLVIQIIDPDMTKPALVTRMDEAEGHFVYVKLNELDLFEQLKGQTGKQHFQLMCLAFDPGAEYGQTRIGTGSVTARPLCRFNWNACTTILKGRRFFRNVLTDGPISRINFCTIPEQEIGAEQPIYGEYDAAFDEALKPYIDNLVSARGLIDCPQAFRLAKKLLQECAEFARLSQDEVYWNLSHRACCIAWLKACVLYVANGQKWEKSIDEFIRWSLQYDLWCKMQFFGEDIAKASSGEDSRMGKRGPSNLLEQLGETFTLDDAKRVRQLNGMSNEGNKCQRMISQWVYRKYVLQITDYSFQKSQQFVSKIEK